jgi:hypothetical protein
MRQLVAEARGTTYVAFGSLDEARADEHGVVVLEGDDGGQIYATCPARLVRCSEADLEVLLRDVDALAWANAEMAQVVFERAPIGAGIGGGMGGGRVLNGVWVHEELVEYGLEQPIRDVLEGRRRRLGTGEDA